jgi:hypothetical protein
MVHSPDALPHDPQQLHLRTALLDRGNGELADLLTDRPGSEGILLGLEDANAIIATANHRDQVRAAHRDGHYRLAVVCYRCSSGGTGPAPPPHRIREAYPAL